jgi:hypothetical protein
MCRRLTLHRKQIIEEKQRRRGKKEKERRKKNPSLLQAMGPTKGSQSIAWKTK